MALSGVTLELHPRKEYLLRVLENKLLRRMFGPQRGNGDKYIMRIIV
jgi:hypothetical protein